MYTTSAQYLIMVSQSPGGSQSGAILHLSIGETEAWGGEEAGTFPRLLGLSMECRLGNSGKSLSVSGSLPAWEAVTSARPGWPGFQGIKVGQDE